MNPHLLITQIGPDLFPVLRFAARRMRANVDDAIIQLDRPVWEVEKLADHVEKALHDHYTSPQRTTRECDVASRIAEAVPQWDKEMILVFLSGFIADNADYKRCIQEAVDLASQTKVAQVTQDMVKVDPIAVAFERGVDRIDGYSNPLERKVESVSEIRNGRAEKVRQRLECLFPFDNTVKPFDSETSQSKTASQSAKELAEEASARLEAIRSYLSLPHSRDTTVGDVWPRIEELYKGFTGLLKPSSTSHPAGTPEEAEFNDMTRRLNRLREFLEGNKSESMGRVQFSVGKLAYGFNADGSLPK